MEDDDAMTDPENRDDAMETDIVDRERSSGEESPPGLPQQESMGWLTEVATTPWQPWGWPQVIGGLRSRVDAHVYNTFFAWIVRHHGRVTDWEEMRAALHNIEQTGLQPHNT